MSRGRRCHRALPSFAPVFLARTSTILQSVAAPVVARHRGPSQGVIKGGCVATYQTLVDTAAAIAVAYGIVVEVRGGQLAIRDPSGRDGLLKDTDWHTFDYLRAKELWPVPPWRNYGNIPSIA